MQAGHASLPNGYGLDGTPGVAPQHAHLVGLARPRRRHPVAQARPRAHRGGLSSVSPVPFVHRLRVRYGECDPQGIVFNANYLLYVDVAFTELWREAVGPWHEMNDAGFDCVVADVHLSFKAPARVDEEIDIGMAITRLGRSSIESASTFRRGDELLATGELRHAVLDRETWQSCEMPAFVRDGLSGIAD